ncbi:MAG: hypothetical protein Q8Q82_01385 [Hydrogenophaga sp.]|nr:hypothetical protein [Hydrogenophaga sp.]
MKSLALNTRYRVGAFEGDACLLVYDVVSISGATIGDDVRDVLDRRPNTARIFVMAPFLRDEQVEAAIIEGSSLQRAGAYWPSALTEVAVLKLICDDKKLKVVSRSLFLRKELEDCSIVYGDWIELPAELREGWLFCLIDMYGGLVNAPVGVHFSKASGKHADKFLRTSSVLLSTEACGLLAFFSLAALRSREPRRIFVDTAPLIAVALAMHRIARNHGFWTEAPPVKSFSSYGGVSKLPLLGKSDLMIVSASTSGGLAEVLVEQGIDEEMLVTLYFLLSSSKNKTKGKVVCDLTYVRERTFGYPPIDSFPSNSCALCNKGFVVAELEGDQFLLERRSVKRLRIGGASQVGAALETIELLARKGLIKVRLHKEDSRRSDIDIDTLSALEDGGHLHAPFLRLISMFAPAPTHFVVAVGLSMEAIRELFTNAGLLEYVSEAQFVSANEVGTLEPKAGANALVLVDYLCDHALLRAVNAQLRLKVAGGAVSYLSALTIADSPRNLADLRIFLQYGEHGAETFIFRSASELMLPWTGDRSSPWALELQVLRSIQSDCLLPQSLQDRIRWLSETACSGDQLFLAGSAGELMISPDFVLLDTRKDRESISQGDVYAVVCNCLAAERCDKQPLDAKVQRAHPTPVWGQSLYVQSVLCPSNFRDFNDAVLRAAMLRGADEQELNYSVDELCSDEMCEVIRADVTSWHQGKGDSLPEFLMSMSSGRLRLQNHHVERIRDCVRSAGLPRYLELMVERIPQL